MDKCGLYVTNIDTIQLDRRAKKRFHNDYIMVYKPTHQYADSWGYVYEHRLVMEEHVNRFLTPKELCHHINHNKLDNRIENLQLMNPVEHNLEHHCKDLSNRRCSICGSINTGMVERKIIGLRPLWLHIKGKDVCRKCYDHDRYSRGLNG